MILVNGLQMRGLDSCAVNLGISSDILMENAAAALAAEAMKRAPETALVFTGKGQNAGDGFAAARHLYNKGTNTKIVMLAPPESLSGSALKNYEINAAIGIEMSLFSRGERYNADVILDCLLGTGFHGEITGDYADAVSLINKSPAYVISADIPSGISADTGKVGGMCVRADKTVTFGFPKIGLYSPLSADFVGEIVVADISIPRNLPQAALIKTHLLTGDKIHIPCSSKSAHKGTNGKVAIAGGTAGKTGAVRLASDAALSSGAGTVTCLVPQSTRRSFMTSLTCAMCGSIEDADFSKYDSVLIGNGLGTSSGAYNILQRAVSRSVKKLILDADAINLLAGNADILKSADCETVITPHPLEFARLCGLDTEGVIENRVELSLKFASEYNTVVILKGAHTAVASPKGVAYINTTGNEGMAKGGSGDVLAGIIAGLAPRFESILDASLAAVYIHGLAGDIAAKKLGKISMNASDILQNIPAAFRTI